MDIDTIWYLQAYGMLIFFNLAALFGVILLHNKQWRIDLSQFRHYTSLVFQICGVIYALFLGFIVWDVWERFYDIKQNIQNESKYLIDLYRDATVFGTEHEELIQAELKKYIVYIIDTEWLNMNKPEVLEQGDQLISKIWQAYYELNPQTDKENIWYTQSIEKLNDFTNSRLTRIFNHTSSVGFLRWCLLIFGGLFLISVPCFFKIGSLPFKLLLVFFLTNIIAFMLFIIFSLDHPFTGHVELKIKPFEYALKVIAPL